MLNIERLGIVLQPDNNSAAKFNAGMVLDGDVVHMLYRYAERNERYYPYWSYNVDHLRYARLDKEGKLIKDYDTPVIESGRDNAGKGYGAQDARIVPFEGCYYIFFTDYNGADSAQVGVARTKDFADYERLGIIPTKEWDKNAFIFPERINGKIAYIHRIEPNMIIDFFDTVEDMLDKEFWENYDYNTDDKILLNAVEPWETPKVGGSVPPIKTELGWLVFYHGVSHDREPFCYRVGACVLDYNNPKKIIARLKEPFFEPTEAYEIEGDVNNVVFPQGAYINDGYLYFCYGAADKRVAMARVKYDELMQLLRENLAS